MGKVKQANGKAAKAAKPVAAVKNASVTKATDSPKAKSKKVAKDVALKASTNGKEKSSKKSKKVETESESDSDASDDSDSDSASDAADSDSDDSDSSSESEADKKTKKAAPKANGTAAKPAAAKPAAVNGKAKGKAATPESSDSSDSSEADDDSDDSDDSEDDAATKAKPAVVAKEKVKAKAEKSDEDSDDSDDSDDSEEDSDDSDDSDDSESEEKKPEAKSEPSKKRKADEEVSAPIKKNKTEASEDEFTTLFVGNLGWGIDNNLLYEAFKECAGLNTARVVTDKAMQRSRGFGYVDFDTQENAQAALDKMNGFELEGRGLRLDPSKPRPAEDATPGARANERAKQHGDSVSPESDTLFVGNLPFDADEDMVSEFFSDVSQVKSLRLPTDQESGNRKGFGYVTFESIEAAKTVFNAKNGSYIGEGRSSRAVRLDYASQKPRGEGGFGGGRGGGGRGGGRGSFGGGFGGGRGGGGRGGGRGGPRGGGRGGFGSSGRGGSRGFEGKKITF